jgi:uncharacterized protein YjbJ (UPF0337 family)
MDWALIEKNWAEFQLNAKARWPRLTPEDLERIGGKRDELIAKVRELYRLDEAAAREQVDAWQAALRKVSPFK